MGAMSYPHREYCRRDHRIIGQYLAEQAWLRGLDCIVLVREDLESFLGLERFDRTRILWLKEDLKPWFKYQWDSYKSSSPTSIHALFLSRVQIDKHLGSGSMTTEERIAGMAPNAPRTERLTTGRNGSQVPSLSKIVSTLSVLAAGLASPKRTAQRRNKSKV